MIKRELKNKWIVLLLAISASISIFIIKFVWNDTPEFWKHGEEFGDVLFNLSIGYIGAFIFYILDIWIPEVKEQKKIRQRIAFPLSRLLYSMKYPIEEIKKEYGNESLSFENIPMDEFIAMVEKIDLRNHEGFIQHPTTSINYNYGHSLVFQIEKADKYIEQIQITFSLKLDFDLIVMLDEIKHSNYHESTMRKYKNNAFTDPDVVIIGDVISPSLYEYYLMFFKLKEYMKNNEIPITNNYC